jgi:1-acyl-sn-glycerol-3-phosphate acyltransferase
MAALRSALFLIFQAITVVPYGLICLLIAPLPLHVRYRFTVGWPRLVLWAAWHLCGIRYEVKGWENLPDSPVVLLSKHQSTWETFYLVANMPRELCFVFKRELLWYRTAQDDPYRPLAGPRCLRIGREAGPAETRRRPLDHHVS